jgi:hypothetical protein
VVLDLQLKSPHVITTQTFLHPEQNRATHVYYLWTVLYNKNIYKKLHAKTTSVEEMQN